MFIRDEYFLLKSFDRAFWMRLNKENKMENKALHANDGTCQCPFNNPIITHSIIAFKEQQIELE